MATSLSDDDVFATDSRGRRERPSLLPWNRRLRHLQGISIRNLSIIPPDRSRGKTITDDDVPYTLNSPAKLLAQSESRSIQHSQSFTNLRSPSDQRFVSVQKASTSYGDQSLANGRPDLGKLRRRSTLHWSGSSPRVRQKKLEEVASGRMADTWFSLHVQSHTEPLYISEEVENAMNPSFSAFDLNVMGPELSRQDQLCFKLWARTDSAEEFILLLQLDFSLQSLQFVGKSLDNFHHPLPANCVLFHLSDGIYTSFTDMPADESSRSLFDTSGAKALSLGVQQTSSYDALMRLANLDDCIQDALATRKRIESQINEILNRERARFDMPIKVKLAENEVDEIRRACIAERKRIRSDQKHKEELHESLRLRRDAMRTAREDQAKTLLRLDAANTTMQDDTANGKHYDEATAGQIRRICEDILNIFPIEPIAKRPLQFTIRGHALPNSKFDDVDKDTVAAALGYTSQVVLLLSKYLRVPLPYSITHFGSASFIEDPISVALPHRVFPLYPINATYRFEYGVFLLNKDVEFLMDRYGLRMLDIRHTLPNLKYLTYVLTAGTGEVPARKAGGVKGLITGRMSPTLSRRGSEESTRSSAGYDSRKVSQLVAESDGKVREKEDDDVLGSLYSAPKQTLSFRSSALRQAS